MNRDHQDDDDVLRGLSVPRPPEGLRERALAAAARAELPEARWLQMLRNPRVRLAWAAAVAMLTLLHVAISIREPSGRTLEPGDEHDSELAATLALPPVVAAVLGGADGEVDSDDEVVR